MLDSTGKTINDFITTVGYTKPFLVLFNNQPSLVTKEDGKIQYSLTSLVPTGGGAAISFSSPKPCIYATAEV